VEEFSPEQVEGLLTEVQEHLRKDGIEILGSRRRSRRGQKNSPRSPAGSNGVPADDPVQIGSNVGCTSSLSAVREAEDREAIAGSA
jgi:hypothetical protein